MKEWEFFAIDLERLREQLEGKNAAMQALGATELAVLLRERKVTRVRERQCRVEKERIERDARSLTESGPSYRTDSVSAELSPLPSPPLAAAVPHTNQLSSCISLPASSAGICSPLTSSRESSEQQANAWVLDNAMTQSFLERLTALLSSSFENVQYACCLALHSILSCSSPSSPASAPFHRLDRDLLVSEGAIRLLLSLLTSSNPLVVQHAGEVLLLLTASMSSAEMLQFVGSREAEMEVWTRIVEDDVRRCEREREQMDHALEAKRVHMGEVRLLCAQQRKEKHDEAQREERGVSLSHTKPRMQRKRSKATRGSPDGNMSLSPSATPLATPALSPYTSNPDDRTLLPTLSLPNPSSASEQPMTPPAAVARPSAFSSPSPQLSPKRSHLKKFEYVLRHIESGGAHITLTSAGRRSRGNSKREEEKEDDSIPLSTDQRDALLAELSALSSSAVCPASFSEYFSSILLSGHALRLERGGAEGWSVGFLLLTAGELRVYVSEDDEPDEAISVLRVESGVEGNVATTEVSGLRCLSVYDLGVHTFAFASEQVRKRWQRGMDSGEGGDVEEETKEEREQTDGSVELTADEQTQCDKLLSSTPIVEPAALLPFHSEYNDLSHSSYLVLLPSSALSPPSAHFFVLSSSTHLYAFPSHTTSPTDADYHFELDVSSTTPAMFHSVLDQQRSIHAALFRLRTKGSMDELRLVAANSVERDRWAHAVLPAAALTASATVSTATPPLSSAAMPASGYSLVPFLSHFGPIDHTGFLYRRRRYSSRWLRQFGVLVGSDLHLYNSPLSSPTDTAAGSVVYLCTASGRPFEVVRGDGCVWEVLQPNGGSVVLRAESETEYEAWRRAIEQSCKRLSEAAAARHRKYTH